MLRAAVLADLPHGFLGRTGGVSRGIAAGLNVGLGSDDEPADVAANRRLGADAILPGATLIGVYQIHSADCVTVTAPWGDDARPRADALVTDRPGLLLAIVTADCAPVLLADREAGVIGAVHTGWKGAIGGVTDATIAAMEELGAKRSRIAAAIGPCIAQASYEVDAGLRDRFIDASPANARFFADGAPGHWQFDLAGYVSYRLKIAGIGTVETLPEDTYEQPARFFSYRRATHRGEPAYGRQMSLIGLAPGARD